MREYLNTWIARIKSETPGFFKNILKFCAILGTVGTGLLVAGDSIPSTIHNIAGYLVAVSVTAAGIAASTSSDPKITNK